MSTDFVDWLQRAMESQGVSQREVVRNAVALGHKLTPSQLSRLLNREQEGTVEVIIAVADGLNLPREVVFRARGWLLTEPEMVVGPGTPPKVAEITQRLVRLPDDVRRAAEGAISAMLDALYAVGKVSGKKGE